MSMTQEPSHSDGVALIYCEDALAHPTGKTAHGLVRHTTRYQIAGVLDSSWAGKQARDVVEGARSDIPIYADLETALLGSRGRDLTPTHLVVGLAPDGGRLPADARDVLKAALRAGLHVVAGLHDWLTEDDELVALAAQHGGSLCDVRRPPHRSQLHFFDGRIERVETFRVALLGTDSAVGKRTTARRLVEGLRAATISAELIGTGQTAWLEGARYSIVLDALVNDFVAGELERVVWRCDREAKPEVMVIEGQGSLMNPAYPGGFEILAATRPHVIVLQHAPMRAEYDGFPGYPIQPLPVQIQALELLSGRPVVAIAVNHEGLEPQAIGPICEAIERITGLPTCDPLVHGVEPLLAALIPDLDKVRSGR